MRQIADDALIVNYGGGWDFRIFEGSNKPPPGLTFHSTATPGSRVEVPFIGMSHPSLKLASWWLRVNSVS